MLEELQLRNYRNIKSKKIELTAGFNCFLGKNGVGKTNILEAVHFFANTRSFRYLGKLASLLRYGESLASVDGEFSKFTLSYTVDTEKKNYYFNKKPSGGINKLLDFVSVVSYAPTFYDLVNTPNNFRLSYINKIAFIKNKNYLLVHQKYKKILRERNILLRERKKTKYWDQMLVNYGQELIKHRHQVVDSINEELKYFLYDTLFKKNLYIKYRPNTEEDFHDKLLKNKEKDQILGYTTTGPHRDQVDIVIEGKLVKGFLSTGESKMLTFLLKLVEASFSKNNFDETIFIYDDAGAFLDKKNFNLAIEKLKGLKIQVLMSSVDKKLLACSDLGASMEVNL